MAGLKHFPIVVAIESDATQFHGEHPRRPRLLDRSGAEQLLAHLSSDLAELLPAVAQCRLAMPGALFDQTQLLRPRLPVFAALESATEASVGDRFTPQLLSIGAQDGRMPSTDLQPESGIDPSTLQLLPLLVSADAAADGGWSDDMEHLFLERGQLSALSAQALQTGFGIQAHHARFMTLTDLMALLHLQLEHFGFLPLWSLLDAALSNQAEPFSAQGRHGQAFEWRNGTVHARFETFDHWANQGGGRDVAAADLVTAYADWTREYRQYLVTLGAHGIQVHQHLPGEAEVGPGTPFIVESAPLPEPGALARVTEQPGGDLGVIALTLWTGDALRHYYPIAPDGLNAIHDALRDATVAAGGLAYPARLCCDSGTRRLVPDALE